MTALAVGLLLCLFAAAFLSHLSVDYQAHRIQQRVLQAEWNARAGLEHYRATRKLPPVDAGTGERRIDLDAEGNTCRVHPNPANGDIQFEGISGPVRRRLTLLGGNPDRLVWEVP